MKRCMVILVAGVLAFAVQAYATIINVPGDQPTIQAGIDASVDGDTVMVADGIYTGIGNIDVNFNGKSVVVLSQSGPNSTTIDCQNNGRAFIIESGETPMTLIEGFTIQNGHLEAGSGGAIFIFGSSPQIINCIFNENNAVHGGAIYANGNASAIDVEISQCLFTNNSAGDYGGAIYFQYDSMTLNVTECAFISNDAYGYGGAIACGLNSNSSISNCTFYDNSSNNGAAIRSISNSDIISNTLIAFNLGGAAIVCGGILIELTCSDIYGNPGGDWVGCIADQLGANGNISEDPLFCYPDTGNYYIDGLSPCNPDHNYCGLMGAFGVGCNFQERHVWHVSVYGDDVNGDGSGENPFATIQRGIDVASDGDTVLVWPGTYTGEGNRAISPDEKSIVIKSLLGAESTIIDVENQSYGFISECYNPPEDLNIVIDGFTITNGDCGIYLHTTTVVQHQLHHLHLDNCVTGIIVYSDSTTIEGCEFSNNDKGIDHGEVTLQVRNSTFIGNEIGIYSHYMVYPNSELCLFDSCIFDGNTTASRTGCTISNSVIKNGNCGIYAPWPKETIASDCIFENITGVVFNAGIPPRGKYWPKPDYDAIATDFFGPGIAVYNSIVRDNPGEIAGAFGFDSDQRNLFFEDCQLYRNGGGIRGQGGLTMIGCTYTDNAEGIYFRPFRDVEISSCTFTGIGGNVLNFHGFEFGDVNISGTMVANSAGHGLIIEHPMNYLEITIDRCTIANNDSDGICLRDDYYDRIIFVNTANSVIAYNERTGLWIDDTIDSIGVFYCDNYGNSSGNYFGVPDQTGLNGNISEDPLFIDSDNGNYHLQCASPCVDTGDPELFDPDSTRSDMGAFYLPHYYSPTETGIIAPPNGSVADSLTWLTWLESTDEDTSCNTVFYRLQIDEDPNFESPEVNVDTLPASGFLLEETISYRILSLPGWLNLLADSTYFWRVGSVDEIGDTSAWTPGPNYFIFVIPAQIPTLSEWGMIILVLLLLAGGTIATIRRRRIAFS